MDNIVSNGSQQALSITSTEPRHKLDGAIPATFFAPMVQYLQTQTDAPRGFVFNGLLMTVAAVIGNRVIFQSGRDIIRPNLYMMFVAGSTINRKSSGVSFAKRTLGELGKKLGVPFLIPKGGSFEGLIDAMRDGRDGERKVVHNSGLSAHGEFSAFLANIRKDYNSGYEEFILEVYDGDENNRRLKKENSEITNPCLSIIGGITMAQLKMNIREVDKHSGFLQRFQFAYEPVRESKMKSIIQRTLPDPRIEAQMFSFLEAVYRTSLQIQKKEMSFRLSEEACTIYQENFENAHVEMDSIRKDNAELGELLLGYHGRIEVVTIKFAMIYEVVKITDRGLEPEDDDLVISGVTMREAVVLARYFSTSIYQLLSTEFKFTRYAQQLNRLESMLRRGGGRMSRSTMLRNSNWRKRDFDDVLETAIASGLMVLEEDRQISGQKKAMVRLLS